ncbi:MAG: glycosyltransferase family 2 protein [Patescibacteria group bacterium]|nr:glycosyltransferase family 2 protein [Patescibacteria group bacterium]
MKRMQVNVTKGKPLISVSFVIPVYNEEDRIGTTLTALKQLRMPAGLTLKEVIFINDGSKDKTTAAINKAKAGLKKKLKARITLVSYDHNRGKGYAVRVGMLTSDADYTLFFDADISTPLDQLRKFAAPMRHGADVIIGTRKNGKSTVLVHQPWYRQLLGKGFTLLSNIVMNVWVNDFTCGFKAFSREALYQVFTHARINRWGYDSEILFLAKKFGYTICQIPVTWSNDERTKVDLSKAVFSTLHELYTIRRNDANGLYSRRCSTRIKKFTPIVA